ncbi:MAG: NAD-dependent epimerase/dehydratase family protein [Bacteroidetes bacterium]|nr:MAG: NAD-dependent epimerase/dehydratase family protein [Bacteroidota bacterium]
MKTYFITGGTGLIGSHLIQHLLDSGQQIVALKHTTNPITIKNQAIRWIEGSILDVPLLQEIIEPNFYVVHAAAVISLSAPNLWKINVEGTANMVNICLQKEVKKFCHLSSIAAIGKNFDKKILDETNEWENAVYYNNYAISKHLAEQEVWRGIAEGLNAVIVNPSVVLGTGNLEQSSNQLFKKILEENKFYIDASINLVDVRDVCQIIELLMESNISQERFILNAHELVFKDFFDKLATKLNKKSPNIRISPLLLKILKSFAKFYTVFFPKSPLSELAWLSNDFASYHSTKIQKALDFKFRTLEDTLDHCADFYKKVV